MPNKEIDKIKFHYLAGPISLSERTKLKSFLLKQLKKEGKAVDAINYIFCDDAYLLSINQQYLKHDTYTDIITFELSPKSQPLLADIYISVERVKENAKHFKSSFKAELLRVIFHGSLHLSGYKDKTVKDAQVMKSKEDEYLKLYGVPRGTRTLKD